jgi:predicted DNA-binding antitoxin AbrB/MazE fold protein
MSWYNASMQEIPAIYEDGVLRPLEPLQLAEHQRVRVSIATEPCDSEDVAAAQRRSMEELDAELAGVPDRSSDDGFSGADHDKILYGDSR